MPCIVDSDGAREFFQDVFESSPLDVVRKFEFWSCTRDKGARLRTLSFRTLLTESAQGRRMVIA